jgi:hypothetical protein
LATNIAKASEIGFPQNLPFIAGAIAQGAQIASILAGANYSGPGGYAEGGYTGPGGKYRVAGVVHAGEGVLSQAEVGKLGGPAGFDRLRSIIADREALTTMIRGYAEGGIVEGPSLPAIDVNGLQASRAQEQRDNSLHLYNLFDVDALAQKVANHPVMEKAVINFAGDNGNAIKAKW